MNLISRGIGGLGSGQLGDSNLAKWELRTVPLTENMCLFLIFVVAFCYEMSERQRSVPNRTAPARTQLLEPHTKMPHPSPDSLSRGYLLPDPRWHSAPAVQCPTPAPFRHGRK
ncbi:uncharacterized protein LOC26536043 [Drosophila yakuba]|uniref:Uncharacterized protein n=1 Tax=Drosophila yakuba TaxID=7245 RepID=A0A0R1DYU3_DROYA|nr:uncharacterized protein LOC26536043 [Drosophila yakuba]KRK01662.1 uncharacterized protein Dyak_GE28862 [Drosophila yakuba]